MLRHRLALSYEALSDGVAADQLMSRILKALPVPERPLETHVRAAARWAPGRRAPPPPLPRLPSPAEAPLGGPRASQTEVLVRRLEWTVVRRLDGLLQGDYRTLFRGFGLDLADLREYQSGDDVRHIDWNVTARSQTPHARVPGRPRVAVWFLLDLSASIDFGSGTVRKRDLLNDFTTVLALLLTRYGNRVGAGVLRRRGRDRHVGDTGARGAPPVAAPARPHAGHARRIAGRHPACVTCSSARGPWRNAAP